MKLCAVCNKEHSLESFYIRRDTGKHYSKCKECFNSINSIRNSTEAGKVKIRARRANARNLEVNRSRERRSSKAYRERYPEKEKAKRKVRDAIGKGVLIRPDTCSVCLKESNRQDGVTSIQAHHDDYSKPLDVRWLCPICHAKEHSNE